MKHMLSFVLFFMLAFTSLAQQIKISKFEELERRVSNTPDTTYIINFWATWCVPCVKEIPFFEQLARKYKDQPLKIVLFSLDFKSKLEKDLIPFIKKNNIQSEVLLAENSDEKFINSVSKNWSGSLPATLIVNKKREIRGFYEKEFDFNQLEELYLKSK